MRYIRIIAPPTSPYFFGKIAAMDMETEHKLACVSAGETIVIPAERAIDLGIAWVRLGAPAVKLRFMAHPGQTYILRWLARGFGAGMGVDEIT